MWIPSQCHTDLARLFFRLTVSESGFNGRLVLIFKPVDPMLAASDTPTILFPIAAPLWLTVEILGAIGAPTAALDVDGTA